MEKEMSLLFEKACTNILEKIIDTGTITDNEILLLSFYIKNSKSKNQKNDLEKIIGFGKELSKIVDKIFPNS